MTTRILAALPLAVLLFTMFVLRWKATRAAFFAWIAALLIGGVAYGGHPALLTIASLKGISQAVYVLLIIWTASFMYQLMAETGAISRISVVCERLSGDKMGLAIAISWCLSAVIQGIAGYGVPVAICAPLMVAAGFDAGVSAAAVLVGHSWAVTFGSMSSSFFALSLSTGLPQSVLSHWVGLAFVIPVIVSGLAVCHIVGGLEGLRRRGPGVVVAGVAIGATQWLAAVNGLTQVAVLAASLVGLVMLVLVSRVKSAAIEVKTREVDEHAQAIPEGKASSLSIHVAMIPFYALIVLMIISQVPPVKAFFAPYKLGVDYPAMVTSQGFEVEAEENYAGISIFSHPAPLILVATAIGLIVYLRLGLLRLSAVSHAFVRAVRQCRASTMAILMMVMMSLVMTDTGMTRSLAGSIATVTGRFFPIASPLIGTLGCFLTGSNTNSNVLFGALQAETATALTLRPELLSASQTVGASLASSIAPSKVMMGASAVGLAGDEGEVFRKCFPYFAILIALASLQTFVATLVWP
jgi:lactate permease